MEDFDFLRLRGGADQRRPAGVDDHQIFAADRGDQVLGVVAGEGEVAAVEVDGLAALGDDAVVVGVLRLGEGGPGADVEPAQRRERDASCAKVCRARQRRGPGAVQRPSMPDMALES